MSPPRFAALILAAGLSSRLPPLKPLLPVDGVPAVVRIAHAFREARIDPLVVIGFAADEVAPALEAAGLRNVVNEHFQRGMYSSLRAGAAAVERPLDWLFVQPADCPLVRGETLGRLMRATVESGTTAGRGQDAPRRALIPTCHGQRGHPPLLSADLLPLVLAGAEPSGGLRTILDGLGDGRVDVPVDDEGVLIDMNDVEGYARVEEYALHERLPDASACEALLRRHGTPAAIVAHSRAVRAVALRLAGAANAEGLGLNLRLLEAAALTHDIARDRPGHDEAAAAVLAAEGYRRVARVARHHMSLGGPPEDPPGEIELLYLADKLVRDDAVVTLEERARGTLARFSGDPEARAGAADRLAAAAAIALSLERVLRRPLYELLGEPRREPGGAPDAGPAGEAATL